MIKVGKNYWEKGIRPVSLKVNTIDLQEHLFSCEEMSDLTSNLSNLKTSNLFTDDLTDVAEIVDLSDQILRKKDLKLKKN